MRPSAFAVIVFLIPASFVDAQISSPERDALIALYNSTNGAEWTNRTNWRNAGDTDFNDPGTECTWYGVTCSASSVIFVSLSSNNLTGQIPTEIGDLVNLLRLELNENHLYGDIPPELGNLASVHTIRIRANMLSGEIPTALLNLTNLASDVSDFRNNALFSNDDTLIAFLNDKQIGGDWQLEQSTPPENLTVDVPAFISGTAVGDRTVWLSWDELIFEDFVEIYAAPSGSDTWTLVGWTSDSFQYHPVTGLDPNTAYDFKARTFKEPYWANPNLVYSVFGPTVTATTSDGTCEAPTIKITWGPPIVLSLTEVYDTYFWITFETTPTVDYLDMVDLGWWWVSVTSDGPCEEAATILVGTPDVFEDGFESGDTLAWSNTVP